VKTNHPASVWSALNQWIIQSASIMIRTDTKQCYSTRMQARGDAYMHVTIHNERLYNVKIYTLIKIHLRSVEVERNIVLTIVLNATSLN